MRRCKHGRGMKEPWDNERGWYVKFADGETRLVTTERCWACKEWLALGKANDASEAVQIEKRAAELALIPAGAFVTSDAQSGWYCSANDLDLPPWPHCPDAWAGWFARCIAEHDDKERG
jgi:hypothetical protein